MMKKIKPLAFYLPQYHPIPENDEWWGKGFTEWTNVGKAKPLFEGHLQPVCPTDLGYYDLRVPEVREQQVMMAKEFGIYGFVYYHYWFGNGRQLLERIANEILASKKPDFPFCFCWANETWSGVWHGLGNKILIEQVYPSDEDLLSHFNYLLPFFKDDRYIKIDGKPVLMIYDPIHLEEHDSLYLVKLRKLAQENGFSDLYIMGANKKEDYFDYKKMGYDGKVSQAFQKAWIPLIAKGENPHITPYQYYKKRLKSVLGMKEKKIKTKSVRVQDMTELVDNLKYENSNVETFPTVLPNWDNTPRSGVRGVVLKNDSAENFRRQLEKAVKFLENKNHNENFIFIKSWNEWAEGNMLEPDQIKGYTYLNTLKDFLEKLK